MFIVISQIIGTQYNLEGVHATQATAIDQIEGIIKTHKDWTTNHDAPDQCFTEQGRWVNPVLNTIITLHEDMLIG